MSDEPKVIAQSFEELQALIDDPAWIHYVGLIGRAGVIDCMMTVEKAHYKPGTDRNKLFLVSIVKFADTHWVVISIPYEERGNMERALAAHGLRMVEAGYIPHVIEGGTGAIQQFPVKGGRMFVLENVASHPVYKK